MMGLQAVKRPTAWAEMSSLSVSHRRRQVTVGWVSRLEVDEHCKQVLKRNNPLTRFRDSFADVTRVKSTNRRARSTSCDPPHTKRRAPDDGKRHAETARNNYHYRGRSAPASDDLAAVVSTPTK